MIGNQRYEAMLSEYRGDEAQLLDAGALYAHELYDKGVKTLDQNLIRGEKAALTSYVGGLISGSNVLLVSIYGTGKTEMISHAFRIVDGIDEDNVVFVPGRPDLTPAELVGKFQVYETTIEDGNGDKTTKTETGRHKPLLHPRVQIAAFDEVTRGNPRTVDTAAQITGTRMLEAQDGKAPMLDMEMAILAMNPTESLRTTTKLSGAMAARQQWGVILGDEANWDDVLNGTVDDDFEPTPEKIEPVSNLKKLHVARAALSLVMVDDKAIKPYVKHVTKRSLITLRDHEARILEGPGRVSRQIIDTSRTFALMHGRKAVTQEDIQDAVRNKIVSTMGGNGWHDLEGIKDVYNNILEAA